MSRLTPRVAMLLDAPVGPRSGGPGTFTEGLMKALHRSGRVAVTLLAPDRASGGAGQRMSQLRLAAEQTRGLFRVKPDVVHVHEHPSLLAAAVTYKLLGGRSVGIVFTSHFDPVMRRSWWKRYIIGWLLSCCARVTVMASQSIGKLQLVATPAPAADRVDVVPAAADVMIRDRRDPAVSAFAESIGCHGGPVVLQTSNYMWPAKVAGIVRLMEAFVEVRRRFPDARLVLVGRGSLRDTVEGTRRRLGFGRSVIMVDAFVDDLSLPMACADVQCHISLQDMCPISLLEAMHAGKPLVASRTGGIPELIEHGVSGLIVDDDPRQIADAIIDLLEHPARAAAMGAAAQRAAKARFTWDRAAADFERLYDAAARRGPRTAHTEAVDDAVN